MMGFLTLVWITLGALLSLLVYKMTGAYRNDTFPAFIGFILSAIIVSLFGTFIYIIKTGI